MAKEPAVPMTALAVISGTADEKMRVFKSMAEVGATSGMLPAGYNTVQKVGAACWMADALQVHPFTFMQGVHAIPARGGGVVLEPKWEFVNALLRSRLPGFKFEVEVETPEECTILFSANGEEHRVTYTIQDAIRQGLKAKNPDLYGANAKEGLYKQAFKRGADRIGAHVLSGLPSISYDMPVDEVAREEMPERPGDAIAHEAAAAMGVTQEPSGATIVDDAVPEPEPPAAQPAPAPPASSPVRATEHSVHEELRQALRARYAPLELTPTVEAEKASLVLSLISKANVTVKALKDIHLQTARAMIEYLQQGAPTEPAAATDDTPPAAEPPPSGDGAAAGDGFATWAQVVKAAGAYRSAIGADLIGPGQTIDQATKRKVPNEARQYLVSAEVFKALGFQRPTLLWEAGQLVVEPRVISQVIDQAAQHVRRVQAQNRGLAR